MVFKKYNHNPLNKKTSDCVVRALGKGLNMTWERTLEKLFKIAMELKVVPTSMEAVEELLKEYPTINVFHEVRGKRKRYTVKDIMKWEGTYLVRVAHHLTLVSNKKLFDTWDCSDKSSYKIWKVELFLDPAFKRK